VVLAPALVVETEETDMDPNANIEEQLRITAELQTLANSPGPLTPEQADHVAQRVFRLAELIEALDFWLTGGGFLPERWRQPNVPLHNAVTDLQNQILSAGAAVGEVQRLVGELR